ncbi:D-isomer specific 2-hydroxyacid dehydrogenase family protein [Robertmurraya sp. DFI.2.37]|uniref:D-isomer specific 2-hydroxyacid dehydrogenase family protein n=1 Tax=Robertmurraya sp. DFI.2.37 TaxID=3031819 RepID=UPI00124702D4|nr:D-isomer specific 2-hydroxyacid dehydrogenase family protein [Robertmurraya sp. DFI.2.37]MDF1509355.1 D-isomer specific 2-hydroxyacid dehydrogenase family protein [Robertmurraya sp. DFI.2.37]
MGNKIAIVNSSSFGEKFPWQLERLKKLGEVERFTFHIDIMGKELAEKLHGFNIIISSVTPFFTREFFEHKDETWIISRHGIGYNNIDIEAATEKGTIVTVVSALVERDAVAENAVTNLLAVVRKTVSAATAAKEGRWVERAQFVGRQITDKTVGVIGLGNIGSRVGEIFKYGFNARVLAYDPYQTKEQLERKGAEAVALEELLIQSDILSLNAYVDQKSYHLLSDREFALMKKGVYITNTARGELWEQDAVLRALESGKIAGLATDVLEGEPVDKTHPFFQYDNVLVTPHTSAYTMECLRGMGEKVVSDVERVIQKEQPDNVVNLELFRGNLS